MDENDIPDISSASTGEGCTVIMIFIALFAAFQAMLFSYLDPALGFAAIAMAAGLSSVAIAILTVGRSLSSDDQ